MLTVLIRTYCEPFPDQSIRYTIPLFAW